MRVWRLVKTKYAASAFDGDGARMHGGRWNSVGVAAVYGADSEALLMALDLRGIARGKQAVEGAELAKKLASLMPGAGHLVHMPAHIYIRVGRYADAIRANEHATHADETFIRDQRPGAGIYTVGYVPHNFDFLAFAASMAGRREQSLQAARTMPGLMPEEMLRAPGMSFMQHHLTRHLQVLARFGMWDEILAVPAPPEDLVHARAMWAYARGRALAARGDVAAAQAQLAAIRAASFFATETNWAGVPTLADALERRVGRIECGVFRNHTKCRAPVPELVNNLERPKFLKQVSKLLILSPLFQRVVKLDCLVELVWARPFLFRS